jgi:hypothetical protein
MLPATVVAEQDPFFIASGGPLAQHFPGRDDYFVAGADLNEQIVFGIQMIAGCFLSHHVNASTQAINDAVDLADGHGDAVFERLNGKGKVVECALNHTVDPRSLHVSFVSYITYHGANLLRFGTQGSAGNRQVFRDGFDFRRDILDHFARRHDDWHRVQTDVIDERHDLLPRFKGADEHGHREARLHEDANRGNGNEDDQQILR